MKKRDIIIIVIVILILIALGVGYTYKKYLDLENKIENKLSKVEEYADTSNNSTNININGEENEFLPSNIIENEENKSTKDDIKNTNNTNNEIIGRIEISSLNIKEDLIFSQIKYTTSGLNKNGNTVVYLENTKYQEITNDTEIYIINEEQKKVIYKVYNVYQSDITDESYYETKTEEIELTLVVKQSDKFLIIQASVSDGRR